MENTNPQEIEKKLPTEHQVLLDWWNQLEYHRGDRAALRRAANIEQILFNPAFHRLWRGLKGSTWNRAERVALIAGLAARIRQHEPGRTFAAQLGTAPAGREKAALSGLRFRRLIQAREPTAILQGCARAIAMCNNRANLLDLSDSVYWWNDRTLKAWAFDYYGANPKAD